MIGAAAALVIAVPLALPSLTARENPAAPAAGEPEPEIGPCIWCERLDEATTPVEAAPPPAAPRGAPAPPPVRAASAPRAPVAPGAVPRRRRSIPRTGYRHPSARDPPPAPADEPPPQVAGETRVPEPAPEPRDPQPLPEPPPQGDPQPPPDNTPPPRDPDGSDPDPGGKDPTDPGRNPKTGSPSRTRGTTRARIPGRTRARTPAGACRALMTSRSRAPWSPHGEAIRWSDRRVPETGQRNVRFVRARGVLRGDSVSRAPGSRMARLASRHAVAHWGARGVWAVAGVVVMLPRAGTTAAVRRDLVSLPVR